MSKVALKTRNLTIPIALLLSILTFTSNIICNESFSLSSSSSFSSLYANNRRRSDVGLGNNNNNINKLESVLETKIKQAMVLSNTGQQNISDAYLASSLWEEIRVLYDHYANDDEIENQKIEANDKVKKKNTNNQHDDKSSVIMSDKVKRICNVLYAAVLTRIGRDSDAILVHDETLKKFMKKEKDHFDDENFDLPLWIDVKISKGEALQRLMEYNEARNEFTSVWNHYCKLSSSSSSSSSGINTSTSIQEKVSQCVYKAALCCMRCNDFQGAKDILTLEYNKANDLGHDQAINSVGFLGVLEIIEMDSEIVAEDECTSCTFTTMQSGLEKLKIAKQSKIASPIYKWFHSIAWNHAKDEKVLDVPVLSDEVDLSKKENLVKLSSINNSPFDDPMLIHLDDKVLLHKLLSKSAPCSQFWPQGFIFPENEVSFKKKTNYLQCSDSEQLKWILKQRAGYGSHGNQIVSTKDAIIAASDLSINTKYLCQEIIQSTLLYKGGRRFSLRVYVIYFPSKDKSSSIYLSSIGLMKVAIAAVNVNYNSSEDIYNAYMTNSGRASHDEGDIQYDFDHLQRFIDDTFEDGTYEKIWNSIQSSVSHVMGLFMEMKSTDSSSYKICDSLISTVPKILGFDYIIDKSLNPWLLEVNRFPGLEARGGEDLDVKTKLVHEVWKLAKAKNTNDMAEMKRILSNNRFINVTMN